MLLILVSNIDINYASATSDFYYIYILYCSSYIYYIYNIIYYIYYILYILYVYIYDIIYIDVLVDCG